MATNAAVERDRAGVVGAQFARVADKGSARHPQLAALLAATGPTPRAPSPMPSVSSATYTAAIPA